MEKLLGALIFITTILIVSFLGVGIAILLILTSKNRRKQPIKTHFKQQELTQGQIDKLRKLEAAKNKRVISTNSDQPTIPDYSNSYQRRYLLTKNEYREFQKLREEAAKRDLIICPKVRLLDLIEPRTDVKQHKQLLWKVQSKHVDFVICDKDMYVQAILELDDGSHAMPDRQERDHFVNQVLTSCGYRVIRTYTINERTLDGLGSAEYENRVYAPHSMDT